jgi:hypothetical protein
MKESMVKELMFITAVISAEFKETIHEKIKDRYEVYDTICGMARRFYLDHQNLIEDPNANWEKAYVDSGLVAGQDGYEIFILSWAAFYVTSARFRSAGSK